MAKRPVRQSFADVVRAMEALPPQRPAARNGPGLYSDGVLVDQHGRQYTCAQADLRPERRHELATRGAVVVWHPGWAEQPLRRRERSTASTSAGPVGDPRVVSRSAEVPATVRPVVARSSVVALTILTFAGTGCGFSTSTSSVAAHRTAALFAARTPYVGDNSRVATLVRETGAAPAGSYTLTLQTEGARRGLQVNLQRWDRPFADTDFREPATLLLGLIGNAEQVTFALGSHRFVLTAAAASAATGFDVKRLRQDRRLLADYLGTMDD